MAVSLKHAFTSNVADSGDTTLVQPSNWNAEHTLTAAADTLLGAVTSGTVTEITCTAAGRSIISGADAAAQRTTLGLGTGDSPTFAGLTLSGVGAFSAGSAALPSIIPSGDTNTGMWFPTADTIAWSTGGTERMRIRADGNIGIGTSGNALNSLLIAKSITGGTIANGALIQATIASDVTTSSGGYVTSLSTAASSFTLGSLDHFSAAQGTIGASSSITNQTGYRSSSTIIGATSNFAFLSENTAAVTTGKTAYGFYSAINIATGGGTTYAFYGAGTAPNYFGGNTGIGVAPRTDATINIQKAFTGATTYYGILNWAAIQSSVTSTAIYNYVSPSTAAASFTLTTLHYNYAIQGTFGAGSAVTTQYAYTADSSIIGATTNFGFYYGNTAAVTTGKTAYGFYSLANVATGGGVTWAFYGAGTANSYFGGGVGIGTTNLTGINLYILRNLTGSTFGYGIISGSVIQSDVTNSAFGVYTGLSTAAATFTLTRLSHFAAVQNALGAGSTVTTQVGFDADASLIDATTNYSFIARNTAAVTAGKSSFGFYASINIATGGGTTYAFYSAGTALSYFAGQTTVNNTLWQYAPAPTSKSTTATLTAAELKTAIINTTGTSYTLTLPLGTDIETGFTPFSTTNIGFDFHIINTASGTITLAVNTGVTSLGTLTVVTGDSAHFRLRRTAANTYVVYRLA